MFKIGEKVVYPVHGAGTIESIESREILGEERSYYVLRLSTGDLQVLVPVDTVEKAGLRPICAPAKLDEVEKILCGPSQSWEENWNKRYRINMDKIKSGDICQLAEVIRSLALRDAQKGLSAGEKKMLDNARRILLSEVILSAGVNQEEAIRKLDDCLSQAEL
ncbi:MAG: CarD family transcriptional regulator [Firmicutes bacterium]|nr:CarD family transcriptional regulator [Bacillota bacterium]